MEVRTEFSGRNVFVQMKLVVKVGFLQIPQLTFLKISGKIMFRFDRILVNEKHQVTEYIQNELSVQSILETMI